MTGRYRAEERRERKKQDNPSPVNVLHLGNDTIRDLHIRQDRPLSEHVLQLIVLCSVWHIQSVHSQTARPSRIARNCLGSNASSKQKSPFHIPSLQELELSVNLFLLKSLQNLSWGGG